MSQPAAEAVGGPLRLTLRNSLSSIDEGRLRILEFLAPRALEPRVVNRLEVIFEELVSNIVRHGFEAGSGQTIAVIVTATPTAIELIIEDDGAPFNPLHAVRPTRPRSIATAPLGGLGIPLIRKLAMNIDYESPAPPRLPGGPVSDPFEPSNRVRVSIATSV